MGTTLDYGTAPRQAQRNLRAILRPVLGMFLLAFLGLFFFMALRGSDLGRYRRASPGICQSNLKQVWSAIRRYADDHGAFPADLEALLKDNYLATPQVLVCTMSNDEVVPGTSSAEWAANLRKGQHVSYVYLPPSGPLDGTRRPVLYEHAVDNHDKRGRYILFTDGTIEFQNELDSIRTLRLN